MMFESSSKTNLKRSAKRGNLYWMCCWQVEPASFSPRFIQEPSYPSPLWGWLHPPRCHTEIDTTCVAVLQCINHPHDMPLVMQMCFLHCHPVEDRSRLYFCMQLHGCNSGITHASWRWAQCSPLKKSKLIAMISDWFLLVLG